MIFLALNHYDTMIGYDRHLEMKSSNMSTPVSGSSDAAQKCEGGLISGWEFPIKGMTKP